MPAGLAESLAWVGGQIEWAARPGKRRQLAENLAHATSRSPRDPYVRRLVHRNITTGARRATDVLWAFARPETASGRVAITPPELLAQLIADGRGAVLSSPHFGPFEAAAAVARALPNGTELAAVTDEHGIGRALHRIRTRMGLSVIDRDAPLHEVMRVLREGGIIVVLADLHEPGMRGHIVDFLDGRCILPGGPAAIARMGRAPLVPFAVYRDGPRRWRLELGAPIDPPALRGGRADEQRATQELATAFSAVLRRMPEQWDAIDRIPWQDRSASAPDL
jgi:KDO2-lipid IV(A) lauroyltransferase